MGGLEAVPTKKHKQPLSVFVVNPVRKANGKLDNGFDPRVGYSTHRGGIPTG